MGSVRRTMPLLYCMAAAIMVLGSCATAPAEPPDISTAAGQGLTTQLSKEASSFDLLAPVVPSRPVRPLRRVGPEIAVPDPYLATVSLALPTYPSDSDSIVSDPAAEASTQLPVPQVTEPEPRVATEHSGSESIVSEPAAAQRSEAETSPSQPSAAQHSAAAQSAEPAVAQLHAPPPSIDSRPPDQTVAATSGADFSVVMPGEGWIYLGERDQNQQVHFVSRVSKERDTVFTFKADNSGRYNLAFQRQDLSRGVTERMITRADIVDLSDASEEVPTHSDQPVVEQQSNAAAVLEREPPSEQPVESSAANPDSPDFAAWVDSNDLDAVRDYLVQQDNEHTLDTHSGQDLLTAAGLIMESESYQGAGSVLGHLLEQDFDSDVQAQLLYWMGQYYESSTNQNYREALQHYETLQNRFPYHELAQRAGVRSRYLRRHFFDIQ